MKNRAGLNERSYLPVWSSRLGMTCPPSVTETKWTAPHMDHQDFIHGLFSILLGDTWSPSKNPFLIPSKPKTISEASSLWS